MGTGKYAGKEGGGYLTSLPSRKCSNTPNANMADHSDGPGLVAWKRG